jgi:CopG family nickel-responsive transcriptional regulator
MPVVSVSLTEKNLETLDQLQRALGLTGRSEAIRVCLRSAESEVRERQTMSGEVEGVLIIVHDSHLSPWLDRIQHTFQAIIKTQLHSHLRDHQCLEVFIIRGDASLIDQMITELQKEGKIAYMKFVKS